MDKNTLTGALLRRSYILFIIVGLFCGVLILFPTVSGLHDLKGRLDVLNIKYASAAKIKFESLCNILLHEIKDGGDHAHIAHIAQVHDYVTSVIVTDKKGKVKEFVSKDGRKFERFDFAVNEAFVKKNGFYADRFSFPELNSANNMALCAYGNEENICAIIDMEIVIKGALSGEMGTIFLDKNGLGFGKNPASIYDIYSFDSDYQNSNGLNIAVNHQTGKLSLFTTYYDSDLNFGAISQITFWAILSDTGIMMVVLLLSLALVIALLGNDLHIVKRDIHHSVLELARLLSNTKKGVFDQYRFAQNSEFADFYNDIIQISEKSAFVSGELNFYKHFFDVVAKNSPVKILFVSAKTGRIIEASESAVEFYGYDKAELLTKTIFDIQSSPSQNYFASKVSKETGNVLVCLHRLANGEERNVQARITPIEGDAEDFYFYAIWDVTRRQKLIAGLVGGGGEFSGESPIVALKFDFASGKIEQISPNVSEVLGYDRKKMLEEDFSFYSLIPSESDCKSLKSLIKSRMESSSRAFIDEINTIKLENGSTPWFRNLFNVGAGGVVSAYLLNAQKYYNEMLKYKQIARKFELESDLGLFMNWEYTDENGGLYTFSNGFFGLLGYRSSDSFEGAITKSNLNMFFAPGDAERLLKAQNELENRLKDTMEVTLRCITKDSSSVWINVRGKLAKIGEDKEAKAIILGTFEDVSERIKNDYRLHLISNIFDFSKEYIVIYNAKFEIIDVNPSFLNAFGYSRNEIIGQSIKIFRSHEQDEKEYINMYNTLRDKGQWSGELVLPLKDGTSNYQSITISALFDASGNVENYISIATDITKIKKAQQQLEIMAYYDTLTKLPNRLYFLRKLESAMTLAKSNGSLMALIYLDLDGFKEANDNYGHQYGDEVLIEIARRLKSVINAKDTVGRFGGDEFVALATRIENVLELKELLNQILKVINEDMQIGEYKLKIGASIGASIYPQNNEIDINELLHQADWSMYQAKLSGKNKYYIFDANKYLEFSEYSKILLAKNSFDSSEFFLAYQPVCDITSGQIISFEALMRWRHPDKKVAIPLDFFDMLREKPWFNDFSIWVIDEALNMLESLKLNAQVSVNIPITQLSSSVFYGKFEALVLKRDVSRLALEINNIFTSRNLNRDIANLKRYRELGVSLIIDNFIPNSIDKDVLDEIPTNMYKLDAKYSTDLLRRYGYMDTLESTIISCHRYGREPIAKAVENVYVYEILRALGYRYIQGEFISRPLNYDEIKNFTRNFKFETTPRKPEDVRKIEFYKFILYQVDRINYVKASFESGNLNFFDFDEYQKKYFEFSNVDFDVPEVCAEAAKIIGEIFSKDLSEEEKASLIAKLDQKRLFMLSYISGD